MSKESIERAEEYLDKLEGVIELEEERIGPILKWNNLRKSN